MPLPPHNRNAVMTLLGWVVSARYLISRLFSSFPLALNPPRSHSKLLMRVYVDICRPAHHPGLHSNRRASPGVPVHSPNFPSPNLSRTLLHPLSLQLWLVKVAPPPPVAFVSSIFLSTGIEKLRWGCATPFTLTAPFSLYIKFEGCGRRTVFQLAFPPDLPTPGSPPSFTKITCP